MNEAIREIIDCCERNRFSYIIRDNAIKITFKPIWICRYCGKTYFGNLNDGVCFVCQKISPKTTKEYILKKYGEKRGRKIWKKIRGGNIE